MTVGKGAWDLIITTLGITVGMEGLVDVDMAAEAADTAVAVATEVAAVATADLDQDSVDMEDMVALEAAVDMAATVAVEAAMAALAALVEAADHHQDMEDAIMETISKIDKVAATE